MHGVPYDLDLTPFRGAHLERIDLGPYIIHFRFAADSVSPTLAVEGPWELRDAGGQSIESQEEPTRRDAYRLHVLLMRTVIDTEVLAPDSIVFRFSGGYVLTVSDQPEYESFSVQPGNVFV